MSVTHYAIGDIHGDLDQLETVMAFIDADRSSEGITEYQVIFIGDLTDRRENSKGVLDYLIDGRSRNEPWIILRGNHDRMFSLFLEENGAQDPILRKDLTWLHPRLGGDTTLASYGVDASEDRDPLAIHTDALKAVPQSHHDLLKSLPNSFETDAHFFAHAGINPERPLADQTEDDLLWIRAPFHIHEMPYEKIIVHGHTPVDAVTHYGNRINIDTGAAYGGPLSVIVIEGAQEWQVTASGRQEIPRA